jgi:hypothetical protein
VEGVRYFLASLEALSDRQFFAGMACTKLWYLYDLGKLLRYEHHTRTANRTRPPAQHDRHVGARPRSPHGSSTFKVEAPARSLTWAGEGARACRLVTNVLYKWNDASLITVLCTAEGFPDMWALLKLTKRFSEKLQQLALPPEYAHAFQAFSILHKLTLTYPATSLSTFKFACTRPTPFIPTTTGHHRPPTTSPPAAAAATAVAWPTTH